MSVTKCFAVIAVVGLFLGTATSAQAAHVSLKDGGYWSNAADWWSGSVPTSSDYPDIGWGWDANGYNNVTANLATATAVGKGVVIGFAGTGTLNITGGTLAVENKYQLGYNNNNPSFTGTGTVNQQAGTVTQTSGSYGVQLGVYSADSGYYNMSGGSLGIAGVYGLQVGTAGTGEFYLSGDGSVSTRYLYIAGVAAADTASVGIFDQTGGTLTASSNLYIGRYGDGTYSVSDGTLSVAGTVAVGTGTGTGEFKVEDITAMITWSGPSATFGANSTLSFVAAAGGVSDIVLSNTSTGALSINSAALLSLDLSAMSSATQDLLLVDNFGTDTITGTFSNYGEGDTVATFGDGSFYTLTYVYDALTTLGAGHDVAAANDLALVATIPEPSTLALLAAGLVGLLAYAWRKRK